MRPKPVTDNSKKYNRHGTVRDILLDEMLSQRKVTLDFVDAFIGDLIGYGCYRNVFENRLDPTTVIKIETGSAGMNRIEFEVWSRVREVTAINKWFAPCHYISGCGVVLLQKKCKPLTDNNQPSKIPSFFTDIKPENFGIYKGHVVCVDYSSTLLMEQGMNLKLVKYKPFGQTIR